MSYGSKIVSYKIASARENAGRAMALGPAVAAAMEKAGDNAPDFAAVHQAIGQALDQKAALMAELHERHHHWRARERHDKARLRAAAIKLRGDLREVRHLFDLFFGTRKGVANFPGRDDLMRLPQHSLEAVSAGLLAVLDDDAFGWSISRFDLHAHYLREKLAGSLAALRGANEALIESRGQRAHAAADRERQMADCEEQIAGMTKLLRGLAIGAGLDHAARAIKLRRPPAKRRKRASADAAPSVSEG